MRGFLLVWRGGSSQFGLIWQLEVGMTSTLYLKSMIHLAASSDVVNWVGVTEAPIHSLDIAAHDGQDFVQI